MIKFKNILHYITRDTIINLPLIVEIRKRRMELEGFPTDSINWDHYAKVLIAKQKALKD
jgi:hypothetical protein